MIFSILIHLLYDIQFFLLSFLLSNFTLIISLFLYFFYFLQIGYLPTQVQQSPWGLDTRSSILIFTTCDKIGTLVNLLTSFWHRCRGLCPSYLVVYISQSESDFSIYFILFLPFLSFHFSFPIPFFGKSGFSILFALS